MEQRSINDIIIFDQHMGGAPYSIDRNFMQSNLFFPSNQEVIATQKKTFMEFIDENKVPIGFISIIIAITIFHQR